MTWFFCFRYRRLIGSVCALNFYEAQQRAFERFGGSVTVIKRA